MDVKKIGPHDNSQLDHPASTLPGDPLATACSHETSTIASNIRLLTRFYAIFAGACLGMLAIGVPFFFVKKAGSAAACIVLLAILGYVWRMSRRGAPQQSIRFFAVLSWLVAVTMLYLGTPPTIVVFVMAIVVVVAVVVGLRTGVVYGVAYLLAWLVYLILVSKGIAPSPYFVGGPYISWFHAAISFLLVLLPVPALVDTIRKAVTKQELAEQSLRETLDFSESILRNSPVPMVVYRSDGHCVVANQALAELLGTDLGELMGLRFQEVRALQDAGLQDDIAATLADGRLRRRSLHDRTSFSRESWIDVIMMSAPRSGAPHILLQIVDYTEQKRGEEALRKSEDRLAMALDASALSTWDFDIGKGVIELDNQWAGIIGGAGGKTFTTALDLLQGTHPDDVERIRHEAVATVKGTIQAFQQELRIRTDSGEWKWIRCMGKVIERDANKRALRAIGTNLDITQRKLAEEQIKQLAFFDSLTNLPNRRMLLDRLNHALGNARRYARPLSVMFLDLDNFKQVNDTYGHDAGDLLLQEVARRLRACVRTGDTISRQGGDEFVIVLTEIREAADAAAAATKIFAALEAPVQVAGHDVLITTSIGISMQNAEGSDDAGGLLKKADSAMYEAKKSGRSRYCFFNFEHAELERNN